MFLRMTRSTMAVLLAMFLFAPTIATAEGKVLDRKALRGKTCAVLDVRAVSEAGNLPPDAVTENPNVKCLFSWAGGSAYVSLRVHRSVEGARQYFEGLTSETTAADSRKAEKLTGAELGKKVQQGELSAGQASAAGALAARLSEEEPAHQKTGELGDEAATSAEGKITVRFGNVTFQVAANRGPEDQIDPTLTRELARQVVGNLERF